MGLVEHRAMPSLRDVAHGGVLCTFSVSAGQGQVVWSVHHVQSHPAGSLSSSQPGRLPCRASPLPFGLSGSDPHTSESTDRYYGNRCVQLLLELPFHQSARVLLSSIRFMVTCLILEGAYWLRLLSLYSDITAYKWHGENQREEMGTLDYWPHMPCIILVTIIWGVEVLLLTKWLGTHERMG